MEKRALFEKVKTMPRQGVHVSTVPDGDYLWLKGQRPDIVLLPASIFHFCRVDDGFCALVNEFASIKTLGPQRTPEERHTEALEKTAAGR